MQKPICQFHGQYEFCVYKVAAIKVGHTRFLPILANRAVNFGAIFMKVGMYVYLGYTKKKIPKKLKIRPF